MTYLSSFLSWWCVPFLMMCPHFIILSSGNRQQLSHLTYLKITTTTQSLFLFRSNNTLFLPMINKYNKAFQYYPNEQTCNNIVADAVLMQWGRWRGQSKQETGEGGGGGRQRTGVGSFLFSRFLSCCVVYGAARWGLWDYTASLYSLSLDSSSVSRD